MKTQTVVVLAVVAGLAVGGYILYKKSQSAQAPSPAMDPNNRSNGSAASGSPAGGKLATTVETAGAVVNSAKDTLELLRKAYGEF